MKLMSRIFLTIALVLGTALPAFAQSSDDWSRADEVVRTIRLPEIPARDYVITNFGALSGGTADARPAIMAAIKKASAEGGGRVVIPPGKWLSRGPGHLASRLHLPPAEAAAPVCTPRGKWLSPAPAHPAGRINLHPAEGSTLLFSPEARHYLPVVLTRWEGTEVNSYSPLIYAFEVRDVAITGKGVIDGNAASEFLTWIPKAEPDFQRLRRMGSDGTPAARRIFGEGTHLRPSIIQFFRAERVLLEDYTVLNSPFWVNHLVYTDHATVRRVRVGSHPGNQHGGAVDL